MLPLANDVCIPTSSNGRPATSNALAKGESHLRIDIVKDPLLTIRTSQMLELSTLIGVLIVGRRYLMSSTAVGHQLGMMGIVVD